MCKSLHHPTHPSSSVARPVPWVRGSPYPLAGSLAWIACPVIPRPSLTRSECQPCGQGPLMSSYFHSCSFPLCSWGSGLCFSNSPYTLFIPRCVSRPPFSCSQFLTFKLLMWLLSLSWLKEKGQRKSHLQKALLATELPTRDQHPVSFGVLSDWFYFSVDCIRHSRIRCRIFPPALLRQEQNEYTLLYASIIWRHLSSQQRFIQHRQRAWH